jgi:hypothetical protein
MVNLLEAHKVTITGYIVSEHGDPLLWGCTKDEIPAVFAEPIRTGNYEIEVQALETESHCQENNS